MSEAALKLPCQRERHQVCGGFGCSCPCHGEGHDPQAKPSWQQVWRSIFGDCAGHEHEQVGRCVWCKPCGRRLYQGTVLTAAERAELKAALDGVS